MGKTLDLKVELESRVLQLHLEIPHIDANKVQAELEKIYFMIQEHSKEWVQRQNRIVSDFHELRSMNKYKNQNLRAMRSALDKVEEIIESDTNQMREDLQIATGEYYERLDQNFQRNEEKRREYAANKEEAH